MTDNSIIYFTKLHWIIFLWPVVMFLGALYVGSEFTQLNKVALLFAGVGFIWILMTWATYHFSSLTIKKNQVILRTGMLVRQTIDIPLNKIESIDIRQTIPGSIFHYGTLMITGTGGTRHLMNFLSKPLTCRRLIEQLMHGA